MDDLLTNIRTLLLAFSEVTSLVEDRIRPHAADSEDTDRDLILLHLPDGDKDLLLDGKAGAFNADLVIQARSTNKARAAAIAAAIRTQNTDPSSGLDGYSGPAGTGEIIEASAVQISEFESDDDDADDNGFYYAETTFSIWYAG